MAAIFFKKLPRVEYQFNINGNVETHELCNTQIKYILKYKTAKIMSNVYKFAWKDGLRPDSFAEKYYGTNELYWLALFSAGIYDIHNELPKDDATLLKYLWKKYKSDQRFITYCSSSQPQLLQNEDSMFRWLNYQIQEYRDSDGDVVDTTQVLGATPITVLDYEIELNEAKRTVNIIDDSFGSRFRLDYDSEMNKLQADLEE